MLNVPAHLKELNIVHQVSSRCRRQLCHHLNHFGGHTWQSHARHGRGELVGRDGSNRVGVEECEGGDELAPPLVNLVRGCSGCSGSMER